jgi:hypothetical protein
VRERERERKRERERDRERQREREREREIERGDTQTEGERGDWLLPFFVYFFCYSSGTLQPGV